MKVHVVGTYPGEVSHRFILTSYVLNGCLAVDAGSLGLGLTMEEQRGIDDIIITHTHMDHIASLPIFIDNQIAENSPPPVIHSTPHNLAMLRKHLFNNVFWPDLSAISSSFFRFHEVAVGQENRINGFRFHLFPVNHPVPTYGVVLFNEAERSEILFSSDTSVCDALWMEANRCKNLKAIFIEVSFPDHLRELALSSGHLTPSLLAGELRKLNKPTPVYVTHYKSQFFEQIDAELAALRDYPLHVCQIGEKISIE